MAWYAATFKWWLALIVFPTVLSFGTDQFRPPMYATTFRILLDLFTVIVIVAWIGFSAYWCSVNMDSSWAIPLGLTFGFIGGVFIAPRRWRTEVEAGI